MATLSGNKIKDTYQSLVKFSDNGNITTSAKQLTDGFGNNSPMFVSTTQVGIGVTPESGLNLHVFGDAKIGSNLTVIGNLVVEGSTTTVGTDTLTVKDPLIVLANNNTSTDAVDIGFYGKYTPSGTTLYSGLFREALTGKYRLFKGLEVEPTTTVNTSGTGYTKADLVIGNLETTQIDLQDNQKIRIGVSQDLEIYHNATNSFIDNDTGSLYIRNNAIDESINIQCDANGSLANYITAEGLTGEVTLYWNGSTKLVTKSNGIAVTGIISNLTDPSAAQDAATKNYVDTQISANNELSEVLANGNTTGGTDIAVSANDDVTFTSSSKLIFTGGVGIINTALEMYHDGTDGYVQNGTGNLIIEQTTDDADIVFKNDDGSGGTIEYFRIDGSESRVVYGRSIHMADNVSVFLGNDDDGLIRYDSTANKILYTGASQFSNDLTVVGDLTVDTDTLFVDVSEDSVGIGLTNPADYSADELVISVPNNSGMTLVSAATDTAYITFADGTTAAAQSSFISHDHSTDTLTIFSQAKVSIGIQEAIVAYFTDVAFFVDKSTTIDDTLTVNGNAGIGGTLDAIDIEVGDGHFIGDDANDNLLIKSSPAESIVIRSQDELFFKTNGDNERMSIDSTGIVKIGTGTLATPSADADDLVIDRGAGVATGITLAAATSGQINFATFTDSDKGSILYNGGTNYMQFRTNGSERMRITGVGNVGLGGNTNPTQKLDIANGGIQIQGLINTPASGQKGLFLHYSNSTGDSRYLSRGADFTTRGTHTFYSQESDGGNEITPLVIDSSGNSTFDGNVTISQPTNGAEAKLTLTSKSAAGNSRTGIIEYDADVEKIFFINEGTTIAAMTSDGKVGIGTDSPVVKLAVKSSQEQLTLSEGDSRGATFDYRSSTGNLNIATNGINARTNPQFTLDLNGNVGIGTDSPDLTGFGYNTLTVVGGTTAGYAGVLELGSPTTNANGQNLGIIAFMDGSTRNAQIDVTRASSTSTSNMHFYTNGGSGIVERMRIDSSGNLLLGNGVGNPYLAFLSAGGNGGNERARIFGYADGGTYGGGLEIQTRDSANIFQNRMVIDSSGRVGIGTTALSETLQVNGNIRVEGVGNVIGFDTTGALLSNGIKTINDYETLIYNGRGASGFAVIGNSNIRLGFGTNYTNAETDLFIDSSGNVGIGTDSPSSKLSISGSQSAIDITRGTAGDSKWEFSSDSTALYFSEMSTGTRAYMMTIKETTGNVGIGTTLPNTILEIASGNSGGDAALDAPVFRINNTTESSDWDTGDVVGSIEYYTSDASGNAPYVTSFIKSVNETGNGTLPDGALTFGTATYNAVGGAVERMRITSGGDVLFGTTAKPNGTSIYGSGFIDDTDSAMVLKLASSATGAKTLIEFLNANGSVGSIQTSGTSTSYLTSSDYRLKENVVEMTGALDRVSQLKPSRFNFIADENTTVDGFLAHEVQDIVPEAITGEKDAVDEDNNAIYQGIDQSKLVPLLVGAIQELQKRIEILENK